MNTFILAHLNTLEIIPYVTAMDRMEYHRMIIRYASIRGE